MVSAGTFRDAIVRMTLWQARHETRVARFGRQEAAWGLPSEFCEARKGSGSRSVSCGVPEHSSEPFRE